MAQVLHKAKYTSGIVGKWHMGTHPNFHPLEREVLDLPESMLGLSVAHENDRMVVYGTFLASRQDAAVVHIPCICCGHRHDNGALLIDGLQQGCELVLCQSLPASHSERSSACTVHGKLR